MAQEAQGKRWAMGVVPQIFRWNLLSRETGEQFQPNLVRNINLTYLAVVGNGRNRTTTTFTSQLIHF